MKKNESIDYLIHKIDNKIKTNIDNHFKVHDLTFSQSQVLHLLSTNGGTVSQKQLQTMMNVSHPTMVGLVQRLEANGFVKTEPDCTDRRNKLVSTTEEALKFREEMIRAREADIQLIVLIEDPHIKDIDMVYLWQNPRYFQWVAKGSKGRPPASSSNIMGIMKRMSEVYGVRWEFARHDQIGAKIVQLLGGC